MDPFQIKFHDFWTNTNPEINISELPDFRKIGPYSSGNHFSESCASQKMMQNRIDEIFWGQTVKNNHYFNFRASGSWTWDLGTRISVPRSWYQDLGTKILVPRFWYQDPGPKILVPESWYQDLGTKILVPVSWYQDLGTKILDRKSTRLNSSH